MDYIICHYSEIGLKGKNRKFFEEKLVENLKRSLDFCFFELVHPVKCRSAAISPEAKLFNRVKRISGRILVKLTDKGEANQKEIEKNLKNIFGLSYFAFAISAEQNIESIQKKALELIKDKKFRSFRVLTKRSNKNFPIISPEINKKISVYLLKHLTQGLNIDLTSPDLTVYIEIVEKYAFLYLEKIKGPGGLPVGVSGKALVLISGGIDSPVAAFYLMKRGTRVNFVHFHAYPYTNKESIKKVEKIAALLNKFQFQAALYLVPFADIQKQIYLKTPAKLRVILYRRFMLKIAQEIAKNQKILALVSGENLGQVASQTLENISVINSAVDMPVLRPLIGQDKEEIIKKAKEINTYEISILPDQDCCSRFVPKHPETRARLKEVEQAEKKLKVKKLIKTAIKSTEIKKI